MPFCTCLSKAAQNILAKATLEIYLESLIMLDVEKKRHPTVMRPSTFSTLEGSVVSSLASPVVQCSTTFALKCSGDYECIVTRSDMFAVHVYSRRATLGYP